MEFKLLISIPDKKNKWRADTETRYINAENLNGVIMKFATVEEIKSGVKILEVWKKSTDERYLYERIV